MLSDEVIEKVSERLINRIEQANTYILTKMGEDIKKIGSLTPTEAQQLGQILKYGGDYEKIARELARITNLNVQDIYEIFEEVAKSDYRFAKQFYDYRGVRYIPYDQNIELHRQVDAIRNIMLQNYISKTNAIGFTFTDLNGNKTFKSLDNTYRELIDKAVLSVSQGKTTFQDEMYRAIKEIGASGLKTLDYESGRSMRLDSAVRMQMRDTLRELHNEEQRLFGEEFDADGVELSVHFNPAPDHEEAQGKQFSNEEYEKLQTTGIATTYDNKQVDMHLELKDGSSALTFRPISKHNCYHYTFAIVLGVSEQAYSNEELKKIIDDNNKGFELDGKHYTNYEGTQLQRSIERKIREQKDIQIMARSSDQQDIVQECQKNISNLTKKYKELSSNSGLKTKMQRLRVSSYKKVGGLDK